MRKNDKSYSQKSVTFSMVQRFTDLSPISDLNAATECIDFALKLSTLFLLWAIFPLALLFSYVDLSVSLTNLFCTGYIILC